MKSYKPNMRTGGQIIVDTLLIEGIKTAFFVPGESFLGVLDAFFDSPDLRPIICRHEGSAVMMAEATARLSRRPGVAFVTKGPGSSNATAGLFIAQKSETPVILFVGLPPRNILEKKAFQACDIKSLFKSLAKSVEIVHHINQLPQILSQAFSLALQGQQGPVVVGLPEDLIEEKADVLNTDRSEPSYNKISDDILLSIEELLSKAERPLIIVGGSDWSKIAQEQLQDFALRLDLPVAAAFRSQDFIDNRHPCYVGHLAINMDAKLENALRVSDLLLFIGAPLDEINTGRWQLIKDSNPTKHIIQVHSAFADPKVDVLVNFQVNTSPSAFAAKLKNLKTPETLKWKIFRQDLRKAYENSQKRIRPSGKVDFAKVVQTLSDKLPNTAIITSGAGNYSQFVHRYFTYKGFGTSLAPVSGSMGYGLPAAIAAKIQQPECCVIAFAGDGCFQMSSQELATAIQYDLPIIIIIADNGMFGTIRMHQEMQYPGRVSGTTLVNPDFSSFAQSFGALGIKVNKTEDFKEAFDLAKSSVKTSVIHLALDPEAITPDKTLKEFRTLGMEKKKMGD